MSDQAEDWATKEARRLVARWEQVAKACEHLLHGQHGSEEHRDWLRSVAVPDIAASLRLVRANTIDSIVEGLREKLQT